MAQIYIGLSGYSYNPWQGKDRFYPDGLKQAEFLRYYANRYKSVELDGVWYRLPTVATVRIWAEQTPQDFTFSPKAHRQITHFKRLSAEALPLTYAMLDRLSPLAHRNKLGPILLQLPPNFMRDDAKLHEFLCGLPPDYRWAVEFRHESWRSPEVGDILRRHGVAWAMVDTDDQQVDSHDTARFWYIRLRRREYSKRRLTKWANLLLEARERGQDCYVYCKHEDEGSPWVWADQLLILTGK
jgi:uncharacterized protein YecE (DUF72 family)